MNINEKTQSPSRTTENRRSKSRTYWYRSGSVDVVVIDSVLAALTPARKSKAKWATNCHSLQARLMSQALHKLTANIKRYPIRW